MAVTKPTAAVADPEPAPDEPAPEPTDDEPTEEEPEPVEAYAPQPGSADYNRVRQEKLAALGIS